MKYPKMDWGTMEAVVNKLGGMEGVERFLRGELVIKTAEWNKEIWNTVKLGTFKNVDEIREALKKASCNIGDLANDILGKPAFTVSNEEKELELVNVSVAELGFKNGATRADIYKRALELGLDICPAEVGPQVALQFGGQLKNGEWFLIGMEPIADSGGYLRVFDVNHDDGERRLYASWPEPDGRWNPGNRVVFLRRK